VTPDTNSTPVCVLEDRVQRLTILLGILQCEQHVVVLLGATATTRERNNDDEPCAGDHLHPLIKSVHFITSAVVKVSSETMRIESDLERASTFRVEDQGRSVSVAALETWRVVRALTDIVLERLWLGW
jgi:hypothetical protein